MAQGFVPKVVTNNRRGGFNRNNGGFNRGGYNRPQSARMQVPVEFKKLVSILKYNADVKRFASIGIISCLRNEGKLDAEAPAHVEFLWNKYAVTCNHIVSEYPYGNEIFISSMFAALNAFTNQSAANIELFINNQMKSKIDDVNPDFVKMITQAIFENANNLTILDSEEEETDNAQPDNKDGEDK